MSSGAAQCGDGMVEGAGARAETGRIDPKKFLMITVAAPEKPLL